MYRKESKHRGQTVFRRGRNQSYVAKSIATEWRKMAEDLDGPDKHDMLQAAEHWARVSKGESHGK